MKVLTVFAILLLATIAAGSTFSITHEIGEENTVKYFLFFNWIKFIKIADSTYEQL